MIADNGSSSPRVGTSGSGDAATCPTPTSYAVVLEKDGTEHTFVRPTDLVAYLHVAPEWVTLIPPRVLAEFAAADPAELPHRGKQ